MNCKCTQTNICKVTKVLLFINVIPYKEGIGGDLIS
jgi:hypothetical protein